MLRRIIRRAVRHGHKLGQKDAFFNELVPALVLEMGSAYPELAKLADRIQVILLKEEQQFAKTLEQGIRILDDTILTLGDNKLIPGDTVFKLYDTYGFPVDLTNDVARERGLEIDTTGFEVAMEEQRNRARSASQFSMDMSGAINATETEFTGYHHLAGESEVEALLVNGQKVSSIAAGQSATIILKQTPFLCRVWWSSWRPRLVKRKGRVSCF